MFSKESQLENLHLPRAIASASWVFISGSTPRKPRRKGGSSWNPQIDEIFNKRHLLIDGFEFTTTPAATATTTATTDFTLPFICIILEHVMLRWLLLKTRFLLNGSLPRFFTTSSHYQASYVKSWTDKMLGPSFKEGKAKNNMNGKNPTERFRILRIRG